METGFLGLLLGLAFALLVLWRIFALAPALRPYAFAAYVMAMAVASLGFEITTDSWWAALAASAALFSLFDRALATGEPRIFPEATNPVPALPHRTRKLPADAPAPRRNRPRWRPRAQAGR